MHDEKKPLGKILQFPAKPKKKDVLLESSLGKQVPAGRCLDYLKRFGQLDETRASLLAVPKDLYMFEGEISDPVSFSSRRDKGVAAVARSLLLRSGFPKDFADYGIHVGPVGGHSYCTLVDKSRKIIVCDEISSQYEDRGTLREFFSSLVKALDHVKRFEAEGKKFDLVICVRGKLAAL